MHYWVFGVDNEGEGNYGKIAFMGSEKDCLDKGYLNQNEER